MKTRWWLILLGIVFAAGWFGGKHSATPAENTATHSQAATPPRPAEGRTTSASGSEPSRKRWAEVIGNGEPFSSPDFMKEVPEKDRGPAIEAWLKSCGSLLSETQLDRLKEVLTSWVAVDADSALAWSSTVSDPSLRELAMTGVAGALAGSDPHRAFEHLVSHGEFNRSIQDTRLTSMMERLSREALALGPEALAELWKRLPDGGPSVRERYGVELNLPAGTDYRAVKEALKDTASSGTKAPIFISGIVKEWFKQDPEGAVSYMVEQINAKENVSNSWSDIYREKKNEAGVAAADQWTCDLAKDLPEDARAKFLSETGFFAVADRFNSFLQNGGSADWVTGTLQYSAQHDQDWQVRITLDPLPEAQRIEYLKTLRGQKGVTAAGYVMSGWKFSESQTAEVIAAIKANQPR